MSEDDCELMLLRHLYEENRTLLRYNGIDAERYSTALNNIDDLVEDIKLLKSGLFSPEEVVEKFSERMKRLLPCPGILGGGGGEIVALSVIQKTSEDKTAT